jgi:UbiD family decarboxylase
MTASTTLSFTDLREYVGEVDQLGELRRIRGANWDREIGALTDVVRRELADKGPALLFEQIEGYSSDHRILTNATASLNRMATLLGLPLGLTKPQYVDEVWRRLGEIDTLPPAVVGDGPVIENVLRGDEVDLYRFPAPHWHAKDGGRYLGTGDCVITSPPDGSWVNLGTYRVSIHDRNHLFVYISPGKHGRQHRDAYFAQGRECPVAISFGQDPILSLMSNQNLPSGSSEYDYAGGLRGEPTEVIEGPVTGLPIPARSEIVIEGFTTTETAVEGPFGEWTGYYASGSRPEYITRVEAVYFRDQPIILGQPPGVPPHAVDIAMLLFRAAMIRRELAAVGVPDVKDVWVHETGGGRFFVAVSIKQRYPGHAQQALMATAACSGAAYMGKYIVVVDDDIDVYDLDQVLFALFTRTDPSRSITLVDRCWSGPLDPAIHPDQKGFSSRALIDACRPWEWRDRFPEVHSVAPELQDAVRAKWPELFSSGPPTR